MAKLPKPVEPVTTADAIERMYKARGDAEKSRPHLGASIIGRKCKRAIWYSFRWALPSDHSGRLYRLFQRGHLEEIQFVKDLRDIGVEVHEFDDDGNQIRFTDCEGHMGGSCDGMGRKFPEAPKSWAVLEFKTHGEKSFNELAAKGVKEAKPEHYVQMNMYMGWSETDRALYLAVNKNTDALHSEWVHFDKQVFEDNVTKAMGIIMSAEPPEKISLDPAWFECKFCDYYTLCHQNKVAKPSCRTCASSTPVAEGQWSCDKFKSVIPLENQYDGCAEHVFIPPLIPYGDPQDFNGGGVLYINKVNGQQFFNGGDTSFPAVPEATDREKVKDKVEGVNYSTVIPDAPIVYSSEELYACPPNLVGDKGLDSLKAAFGGRVSGGIELDEDEVPF
jgi:hypothetical protein